MMKYVLSGALGATLAVAAHAQEIEPPQSLVSEGELTYGTAATFAPFEYQEGDRLVGFDIELGEMLASKMGLQPAPLNMEFKGLIPALQGGRLDIINSAMYINEERATQVDFVPYLQIGNEIVVQKGNPESISSREDVCGMTIAVTLGGIQETYARQDAERCAAAGEPEVTVLTFPTAQDSALAVRRGRAEVFYNSTPGAVKQVRELPDAFEIAGETFEADTQIGIAVRKGDAEMKQAIEQALQTLVEGGQYESLVAKYGLPKTVAVLSQ
jgi:polar amino acid transport system substrate-binding protein